MVRSSSTRQVPLAFAAVVALSGGCGLAGSLAGGEADEVQGASAKAYCEAVSRIEHFPAFERLESDELARAVADYEALGAAASEVAPDGVRSAANTVADAMAEYSQRFEETGFDPAQISDEVDGNPGKDFGKAQGVVAEWLRLNCPDDLDDPASVIQHLFEVTLVPFGDCRTFVRETVGLFAEDAVLIGHPDAGSVIVEGAPEIGDVLLIGRDEGTEADGVDVVWARGDVVVWNEVWLLPDGSVCTWMGNEAVVRDGRIVSYDVGDQSCSG